MDILIAFLMLGPFMAYGLLACIVEEKKRKNKEKLEQENVSAQ